MSRDRSRFKFAINEAMRTVADANKYFSEQAPWKTRLRRAVDPGSSADPAGLTARARPYWRAANLRNPRRSPSGDALRIPRAHVDRLHTFSTRSLRVIHTANDYRC